MNADLLLSASFRVHPRPELGNGRRALGNDLLIVHVTPRDNTWVNSYFDSARVDRFILLTDACSCATILDDLMQLRNETGMTLIFITHDIDLAYYVSDTVYIMEHGKFVERGSADTVLLHPKEPYTKRLISDVPKIYEEWDLSTV